MKILINFQGFNDENKLNNSTGFEKYVNGYGLYL